ncbi:MAG: F0F1 ATP synthase subunit delta, partial [Aquificota bacterium]|nr:F0F1 ATP synthase subunit delta [Aquificota bacterium]
MVRDKETARRLAKVLLRRVPRDKLAQPQVSSLGFLAYIYRKSREFRNFFLSPFVPRESKEKVLSVILEKFSVPKEALEVFQHMVDTHSLSLLPDMKKAYDHEVERIMRMSKGHLYLADDVGEDVVVRIKETLRKVLGRDVEIDVVRDPDLIGGFLFKTSGFVLDTSV